MFEKVLIPGAKNSLEILGKSKVLENAYLAGGTAAALQLGHRVSVDFDFFTKNDFIPGTVASQISQMGSFKVSQADKGTVLGIFEGVRFSLFVYKYPLLFKPSSYLSLRLADLRDIAAMKIDAIASRGAKRDFIDLYFICQLGFKLEKLLQYYNRKYKFLTSNLMHVQKSLVFFDDAEQDEMPKMLKKSEWADVKRYFSQEVKSIF